MYMYVYNNFTCASHVHIQYPITLFLIQSGDAGQDGCPSDRGGLSSGGGHERSALCYQECVPGRL